MLLPAELPGRAAVPEPVEPPALTVPELPSPGGTMPVLDAPVLFPPPELFPPAF